MVDTNRTLKQSLAGLSKYARDWLTNLRRESGRYPAEVLRHINILEEDVLRAERISDHLGEENTRLRAALERYGRHEHPNCHDLTLNADGSFGPRNGCLCAFDAAKGDQSPKDQNSSPEKASGEPDKLVTPSQGAWYCGYSPCRQLNSAWANTCGRCGHNRPEY